MKKKGFVVILFVAYLLAITYVLFFAETFGRTMATENFRYNIRPFKEIWRFIQYAETLGFRSVALNLGGNILMFVPFGIFMGIFQGEKKRVWLATLWAFNCSLLIELSQLLSKVGSFDVDDIILNTLGGFIGIMVYKMFASRSKREK